MKPYGTGFTQSPRHVKRGGAPNGYYDTWVSYCRCCNGTYVKFGNRKIPKGLKKKARQKSKAICDFEMLDYEEGD